MGTLLVIVARGLRYYYIVIAASKVRDEKNLVEQSESPVIAPLELHSASTCTGVSDALTGTVLRISMASSVGMRCHNNQKQNATDCIQQHSRTRRHLKQRLLWLSTLTASV